MKDKRWSRILELCEKQNIVTVEELVQALHVSEATIDVYKRQALKASTCIQAAGMLGCC